MLYNWNIPFVAHNLHSDNVSLLGDTELVAGSSSTNRRSGTTQDKGQFNIRDMSAVTVAIFVLRINRGDITQLGTSTKGGLCLQFNLYQII